MLPSDGLERPLFVVPPPQLVEQFDQIAISILNQIEQNHDQTEYLTEMRETLLPKLISGGIRVGEVKDYMEDIS